ncbi:hypothetical protein, partial [Dysosmobacter segnis]|uniref:hypothetical protein n=1 Tax=Dysosmobacter segnis TaxID=2763042 RepID=UPI001A9AE94A
VSNKRRQTAASAGRCANDDTDKRTNANGLAAAPIFLFCDFIISVLSCQSFSKKQGRTGRSSETE